MNAKRCLIAIATVLYSLTIPGVMAVEPPHEQGQTNVHPSGHERGHAHGTFNFGRPGKATQVNRTIQVKALDTMKYDPAELTVKPNETVRFIVTNAGQLRHEFVIGDATEQRVHAQMMQKMPTMVHEDPNAVTLEPGQTKTLTWQFAGPGIVEMACHVPGHYEAGMVGRVYIKQ